MRYVVLIGFMMSALFANNNPFNEVKGGVVSNQSVNAQAPKRQIKLPADAKVIRYIILGYESKDGVLKEKRIPMSRAVNTPAQSNIQNNSNTQRIATASTQAVASNDNIGASSTQYYFQPFFNFDALGRTLIVHTNDEIIRHFVVKNPDRLVLDFKRDKGFPTSSLNINDSSFKKVSFGSHKGFYRASFVLDGVYQYDLIRQGGDIIIKLK